jgi:hypothetical protein
MRFGTFTSVSQWFVVSCILTVCSLVGAYQRFGETYRVLLQDINEIVDTVDCIMTPCK